MMELRHEMCTRCKELLPADGFAENETNRNRGGFAHWCRDCERQRKDVSRQAKRLEEITNIEWWLTLDRDDPDRYEFWIDCSWFKTTARSDPAFEYVEGECLVLARLRWLKQRTENRDGR